ncbi:MAG: hypothetical protein E7559_07325 [Ruminococcaceae bacterium]|nr:hypothetical protein [Oscillospiraceae bacterium]
MNNKNKMLRRWLIITLCCALVAFAIPAVTTGFFAKENKKLVVVLDPGHGGSDVGAANYSAGLYESDLNLAIALACYEELQNYAGIEVYMTHRGIDYSQGVMSLNDRISFAGEVDADILISLHCNDSDNAAASGAEVYVSHSTYKQEYYQDSTELALCFLEQFKNINMRIRGVKTRLSDGHRIYYHDDGSEEIGDYYAVIGGPIKNYGIPGILVEHAFVKGDSAFLSDNTNLTAFGIADARAIAEFYNLKLKSEVDEFEEEEDYEGAAEVIVTSDRDIISASDVRNRIISIPQPPTVNYYEDLQEARLAYEKLSYPAKTLVSQSDVDNLYHSILVLDEQMYPVRLTVAEQSVFTVNRVSHTLSGVVPETESLRGTSVAELEAGITTAVSGDAAADGAYVVICDSEGTRLDIGAQVGTGTEIQLWRNGEMLDRLLVIIPYDISGDGRVDSRDQLVLEEYIYNRKPLSEASLVAADVNGDRTVNEKDIDQLIDHLLK